MIDTVFRDIVMRFGVSHHGGGYVRETFGRYSVNSDFLVWYISNFEFWVLDF